MFKEFSSLKGKKLRARNGGMGKVSDVYFDEISWDIRYIVADTGKWLLGKKVLLIPLVLERPDENTGEIPVDLTREQIRQCPDTDVKKPVSRQQEIDLHLFFKWIPYWDPDEQDEVGRLFQQKPRDDQGEKFKISSRSGEDRRSCLHSSADVKKYFVSTKDGYDIGRVRDFIVDIPAWANRFVVVDTGNWLPGRKVLISPQWIKQINWVELRVYTDLNKEEIQSSPEYDPSKPLDRLYEVKLRRHYRSLKHS